jgi:hypothetical protein
MDVTDPSERVFIAAVYESRRGKPWHWLALTAALSAVGCGGKVTAGEATAGAGTGACAAPLAMLPADREVADFVRTGEPVVVTDQSTLYAEVGGAAPAYLDRGWSCSAFAEYRQGGRTVRVALHDMSTEQGAAALFSYEMPAAAEPLGSNVVVANLSSAYETIGYRTRYYAHLAIDSSSDAAKQAIGIFTFNVLDKSP